MQPLLNTPEPSNLETIWSTIRFSLIYSSWPPRRLAHRKLLTCFTDLYKCNLITRDIWQLFQHSRCKTMIKTTANTHMPPQQTVFKLGAILIRQNKLWYRVLRRSTWDHTNFIEWYRKNIFDIALPDMLLRVVFSLCNKYIMSLCPFCREKKGKMSPLNPS